MKTALIITLFNEEHSVKNLLRSIIQQTKEPDEIIFVDGDSIDKTPFLLEDFRDAYPGKAKVTIIQKKLNRAAGRNAGIKLARAPVIAITDGGCVLKKDWLECITAPFKHPKVDVVAGFYLPVTTNEFSKSFATYTCVPIDKVAEDFLPSTRSIAFKKSWWKKVGGYPEKLKTCEDLVFARSLKKAGAHFFVEKKAIVLWRQKTNIVSAFKQLFGYSVGDGEAHYLRFQTPFLFARYLIGALLVLKYIFSRNEVYLYVTLILFFLYLLWAYLKNFRYVKSSSAMFYLPALQLTSDFAVLIGMPFGFIKSYILKSSKKTSQQINNMTAALYGGGWMGILQIAVRGFTFLKYAVILRLLTPLEFGVYSLAIIILGTIEVLSEFGTQQFLVQHKNGAKYTDTAFVISIIRGFCLLLLLLTLAFPLSYFFNQGDLIQSILLISFIPLIKGFINPHIYTFQKKLEFHKDVFLKFIGILADSLLSIILILFIPVVYMLFIALIISSFAETLFSYILLWRFPKVQLNKKQAGEILEFSKWLLSAGGIHYITSQIDSLVIGRVLGVPSLGIYQASQRFSLKTMTETGDIPAKISFPIFTNIKKNPARFRSGFLKTITMVSIIWGFIAFVLVLFSEEIIPLLMGKEWIHTNYLFKIFVFTGYLQVVMGIITSAFLSIGRQDYTAKIVFLRLMLVLLLIFPMIHVFGEFGAALAVLISTAATFPLALQYVRRIT